MDAMDAMDPIALPEPPPTRILAASAAAAANGLGDDAVADSPPPRLQPWEQHGGVIHMPRYLYSSHAAPLLHRSGFLVTCAFQREKSATKEAMEILHEFLDVHKSHDGVGMEPDAKRARTGAYSGSTRPDITKGQEESTAQEEKELRADEDRVQTPRVEVQGTNDNNATRNELEADNVAIGEDSVVGEIKQQEFHLVKLARNGMVYISIPSRSPGDLVTVIAKIFRDFHTRSRAAPRWCHRIFPVQATCIWSKEDVRSNVVILVKEFIEGHNISSNNPLKYAVAVNRRGLEEKEKTGETAASTVSFGKLQCIHAVTEAIQSLTPYISVDLTNPQMVVILEVLPLVRVETTVCAVSVLPRELVVTKPKLVIQALAPPKKQKKKHLKEDG